MFRWLFDPTAADLGEALLSTPSDQWDAALARATPRRQAEGLQKALSASTDAEVRRALLRRLAPLDPQAAHRFVGDGWDAGDLALVEEIAAGALRVRPGHVEAAEDLIHVWLARGERERARKLLARAPRDEPVFTLLEAELLAAEGERERALTLAQDVCARAYSVLTTQPTQDTYWRRIELRAIRLRDELSSP